MPVPPVEPAKNTAPFFVLKMQDTYTRVRLANSTDEVPPVILGKAYDNQDDGISQEFKCLSCSPEHATMFSYDSELGLVRIDPNIPFGQYYFKVTLSDDDIEDPKISRN